MSDEEPNPKRARLDSVEKKMIDGIWSDDPSLQLECTIKFRNLVSLDMTPSTENVIESGVVDRLVQFLYRHDSPKLQREAAWAITNTAYDKPDVVVDNGAVPILIDLLNSANDAVPEMAIRALCFVAGSSTQNSDYALRCGVVLPLCRKLNDDTTKLSILRIGSRTLSTFCRGLPLSLSDKTPTPLFDMVKGALPTLKQLLYSNDEQLLKDACSALFYMSYGSQAGIHSVIKAGFIPRLVQLLKDASSYVCFQLLSIIWLLIRKDKRQIQCVIDGGALPIFANLLTQDNEKIIKDDTCWIIKDITEGTKEQIQSVLDANLIPILVNLAQNAEPDVKMKAVWAISGATSGGCHDQIKYLVGQSCIKPLCDNLVCRDITIIIACLDGLGNILKVGETEKNYYLQLINDEEGQGKIEKLQIHSDFEIKEKAVKMMETYWPGEEDELLQLRLG